MPRTLVFLGAPSRSESVLQPPTDYAWTLLRLASPDPSSGSAEVLPPGTYNEASTRLTDLYKGVVFRDEDAEESDSVEIVVGEESAVDRTEVTDISIAPTDMRSAVVHSRVSALRATQLTPQSVPNESLLSTHTDNSNDSISRFPTFHINLHTLTSLSTLSSRPPARLPHKANILVAILEVEGPDQVTLKRGKDAGSEVALLKLVVGDEESRLARVTAWRAVASAWSIVRKGDTVLLESISPSPPTPPATQLAFTASPWLQSRMTICFRSLPLSQGDRRYRPDLRIGETDPGVRKVGRVKEWVEKMAGVS